MTGERCRVVRHLPEDVRMSTRQVLGLFGATLLLVGVFCPLVSMPFVGSITYFGNGRQDGWFILAFGAVAVVASLARWYRALPITGLAALAQLIYVFVSFQQRMSEARESFNTSLAGNPFRGLAEGIASTVQIQWGFAVMALGGLLLLATAVVRDAPAAAPQPSI